MSNRDEMYQRLFLAVEEMLLSRSGCMKNGESYWRVEDRVMAKVSQAWNAIEHDIREERRIRTEMSEALYAFLDRVKELEKKEQHPHMVF